MKTMLLAFVAMGVISVGAYFVLGELGFTAEQANTTPTSGNVRLD
ncbi:hypothetical protein [Cognatishimia sp. MH4019]|nr:hypothetical protein [Cognatishimia sp. MH4019]